MLNLTRQALHRQEKFRSGQLPRSGRILTIRKMTEILIVKRIKIHVKKRSAQT